MLNRLVESKKEIHFFPLQPEITALNNYIEYEPPYGSSKNIALYYQFDAPKNSVQSFSIVPDGCFDIIFCLCEKNHNPFLWTSPTERSEDFHLNYECRCFAVRFLPKQTMLKINCTMKELIEKEVPLEKAISIPPHLIEEIADASSFSERIEVFEKHNDHHDKDLMKQAVVEYCLDKIYLHKGKITIRELADGAGYTDRYLRKIFDEYVGFSPKGYSEIIRFQNTLSMVVKEDGYNILDVVYENGYYDQAHFIRSFRKHAQMSPHEYRQII